MGQIISLAVMAAKIREGQRFANMEEAIAAGCGVAEMPKPEQKAPAYMPAYCDPANEKKGPLYEIRLDFAEIAKRMRKAIKEELPGVKASVRIDRFAGGSSIDIRVKAGPFSIEPLRPWREWEEENLHRNSWKENFQPALREAMEKIKEIHGRWNRDNSDSMVDYFDVNYYGSVAIENGSSW
jgi:hypothetical protein